MIDLNGFSNALEITVSGGDGQRSEGGAYIERLTWHSDAPCVATVSEDYYYPGFRGRLAAWAPGEARFWATNPSGAASDSGTVMVLPPVLAGVSITGAQQPDTRYVGSHLALSARAVNENHGTFVRDDISWSVSDTQVLAIDRVEPTTCQAPDHAYFLGRRPGTAMVYATLDTFQAMAEVRILEPE